MPAEHNHYQKLGLEPDAPAELIEAALWRLVDRAVALAYTSPERSDALWEEIRAVRRDLLSGDDKRRHYNRSLLDARDVTGHDEMLPLEPVQDDAIASQSVRPHRSPPALPIASRQRRRLGRTVDGAVGAGLAAALVAAALHPWSAIQPSVPAALALSSSGPREGHGYMSGERILLHWSHVSGAVVYRLRIAALPDLIPAREALQIAGRTHLIDHTSYRLRVVGAQFYYWQVQVYADGKWQTPSEPRLFAVSRPQVAVPAARTPARARRSASHTVRLCWSAVPGAAGYTLRLSGAAAPQQVSGTCRTERLGPGRYTWQVAARSRGIRVYQGSFSSVSRFTVAARHVARQVRHAARGSASRPAAPKSIAPAPAPTGAAAPIIPAVYHPPAIVPATSAPATHAVKSAAAPSPTVAPPPPPPPTTVTSSRVPALNGGSTTPGGTASIPPPPPPPPAP